MNTLPEFCYAVLPTTKELIRIERGESGYHQTDSDFVAGYMIKYGAKDTDELADKLNALFGTSKAQRAAMENGSMFGWHVPAANPNRYNDEGNFKYGGGR